MGSRDCFVGSSQGNPQRRDPMAQQCNRSGQLWSWGTFWSAAEKVAVVERPSLRCFQRVRGRETRPGLRLNHC